MKVLVVDDTDHVRRMLVDMLELDGFEVVGEAASGAEAVQVTCSTDPDVVVMDYKMPGMDGVSASRAIRQARPKQSIILYTAYLDDRLEGLAKEAGIALCLGKVAGLNQLERHIAKLTRDLRPDGTSG